MARPGNLAADPISVLSPWSTLEPLPDVGLDLGLGGLRILPSQLLPQHRLSELEER
jgi:hypothetical protein